MTLLGQWCVISTVWYPLVPEMCDKGAQVKRPVGRANEGGQSVTHDRVWDLGGHKGKARSCLR
jgi:hypothetical protein